MLKRIGKSILIFVLCLSLSTGMVFGDGTSAETTVTVNSFEELREAFGNAPDDGSLCTIVIASDVVATSTQAAITVASGQNILVTDDGEQRNIKKTGDRCVEVFRVLEGGSLTLKGSVNGAESLVISGNEYSDSNHDNKYRGVVSVFGEFTMDNVAIQNFNIRTYYSAAVYVAGSGIFCMDGGAIRGMRCRNQVCAPVFVWEDGSFVMNGGSIEDNWISPNDLDTAAVRIESFGGHSSFTMNGGIISGNQSYCGAVFVGLLNNDLFYSSTWDSDLASMEMNGGVIRDNTATFSGGGISVMGSGELTMNGGSIINNSAPMGGGIAVYDLFKQYEDYISMDAVTFEDVYNLPARLTINGGSIVDNKAIGSKNAASHSVASDRGCGGGIYIATMNAEISSANILGNFAEDQGGGIYVGAIPYEAKILNAVITENTADDIGAGIWTCPTGSVVEWLVHGAAVYGNVLTNGQHQDIYYEAKILGLAPVTGAFDESDISMKYNTGDVLIKYNHSAKGGGLGTNGTYIFGEDVPVPPDPITPPPTVTPPAITPPITTVTPPAITPPMTTVTQPAITPPTTTVAPPTETPQPEVVPPTVVPEVKVTYIAEITPAEPEVTAEIVIPQPQEEEQPILDEVPKTGIEDELETNADSSLSSVDEMVKQRGKIADLMLAGGYILPVAQSGKDNPMYYLRRTLNGRYSVRGTVFADYSCSSDSENILLYGHNMKDGSMFSDLVKYENPEYFGSHRTITLSFPDGVREYNVIAVFRDKVHFKNEDCFKYYEYGGNLDESKYYEYVCNVKKLSEADFEIPSYGTQLLTLSTCAYHTDNGRLVVVAERIK